MNTQPNPVVVKPDITSVPFPLRRNDVKIHILNVDSRFRQRASGDAKTLRDELARIGDTSASDFYFAVNPPIKNVIRLRVTSIEFPNNYPFFTPCRRNVELRIIYSIAGTAVGVVIEIPTGNYTAEEMTDKLNSIITAEPTLGLTGMTVEFDFNTGQFTFKWNKKFAIDATWKAYERPFDFGLAYYLGFTRNLQIATSLSSTAWELTSNQCANFAGDSYLLLQVNDYNCVRHNTGETELGALAKIILREPKSYMVFDDYTGQHAKEVVFPTPQNISRLHIQVLNPYGQPIDMCAANFSFSLEITEVQNSSLYNSMMGSQASHYF
jgi:hypothetical protein